MAAVAEKAGRAGVAPVLPAGVSGGATECAQSPSDASVRLFANVPKIIHVI